MIAIRPAHERGHGDHGWLQTYHTFSFGDYHDPEHMRFRALRVLNEDWIAPGQGFGTHPHRDMEIITYVLAGTLEHRDSVGHGEILRAGELQRMSAGTGIAHSEFNPSPDEPTHLIQIWLFPRRKGVEPSYEQRRFPPEATRNRLSAVASPEGAEGSLRIGQDARLYVTQWDADREVAYALAEGRHAWLQVLRGEVRLNGVELSAGDGAAVSEEAALTLRALSPAETMLFDLA